MAKQEYKQTVITIPADLMEDLRNFHQSEYGHLSFSKMFVHIVIEEMKHKKEKEA